jgi:hypothetical protein
VEAAKTEHEHEHEPVAGEVLEDGTVVVAESPPELEPEPEETEPEQPPAEPEPEPEPEQGYSEADLEKMRGSLEKEATRHANRVSEIMGEMANTLVSCELCDETTPGFHWPAEMVPPSDDLRGRLFAVLRNPAEAPLRESPHTETCPDCDGWGKVLSGSLVADNKRIVCPTCKGLGYKPKGGQFVENTSGATVHTMPVAAPDVDVPPADADPFGSPRLLDDGQENPNYGKMPQFKNPELP